MTAEDTKKPGGSTKSAPGAEKAARQTRLAEALRANLKRRKEQSRARQDTGRGAPPSSEPADRD